MKLKTSLSLLSLAVCAACSTAAFAQHSGTLTVNGNITDVSCTPTLTGGAISGSTLTLPNALVSQLATAAATANETPFSFELTGCTTSGGINNLWVHFSGANVDSNGRLKPTSGSNNVRFELRDGANMVVAGGTAGGAGPGTGQGTGAAFTGSNPFRAASKSYAVRYYAESGLTTADTGTVQSSVTYNIYYY